MILAKDDFKKMTVDDHERISPLSVNQLGKPWHRLSEHVNKNYDNFDASLSLYFLKKFRINTSLANIYLAIGENKKCHQIYNCSTGKVAFEIDRVLLLNLLHDFYGVSHSTPLSDELDITQTEKRLQERLGEEICNIFLTEEMIGQQLKIVPLHNQQHSHWAWSISFQLRGYQQGEIRLLFDHPLIDQIFNSLRAAQDKPPAPPLTEAQLEKRLRQLPFQLTAQLVSLETTLTKLMNLQVGEVMPIMLNDKVAIKLGDELLFHANVSEHQGQLVLSNFINNYAE